MNCSSSRVAALGAGMILFSSLAFAHEGDRKLLDKQPAYQGRGWRNAYDARVVPNPALVPATTQAPGSGAQGGGTQAGTATQFARSNVTLLSWLPLSDFGLGIGANGNSCFGYTAPSGREYALFGHSQGTAFVEISQPGNPVIVGQIAGPQSLWRDIRVFSHYAYAISEGGSGIQVIDMGQIDAGTVTLVNTVLAGGEARTHTLEINTQSGYLYRAGGPNNGLRIYDLNANPANPTYVGGWFDRYVHEVQVVTYPTGGPGGGPRELAICCGGLNNGFSDSGIDIVDVTNKAAPVSLAHISYGSPGYSHQAWLSPDRTRLYHNDETDARPYTRVFDASQLNSATPTLTYLGEFQNGVTVDHNLYTLGSLIYEANYRSGLRVFDTTSGSTTPTLVAWFDTYPADDDGGYNGLWNNYPYFPSGVTIGSDLERGLFVWWVGAPQIAFTFPNGLPTTLNPAGQTVVVEVAQTPSGTLAAGSLKLNYDLGAGWQQSALVPLSGNRYAAVFPPVPCGTSVAFSFEGESTNGIVWNSPESAPADVHRAIAAFGAVSLVAHDFETAAGWTGGVAGDTATSGTWVRGNPVGTIAQPEDDHSAPGTLCWFTGQGTQGGSSGAADVDGGRTTLLSPIYDLSSNVAPQISYWRWYSNDTGAAPNADTFRVDITNNGTTWVNVETVGPTGPQTAGGWFEHRFSVEDFVPVSATVRLRFVADDANQGSVVEAAIDDLAIHDLVCSGTAAFCFGDGSGTACPCGNQGAPGSGCAHSGGNGATLAGNGVPSVGSDTLQLAATQMPSTASVLFFQGTQAANGGLGNLFGDGLRCTSGSIVRLATKTASGGAASFPTGGDPSVSVRGSVPAGATRYYQSWYRNQVAFCTSDAFNFTNGVSAVWAP